MYLNSSHKTFRSRINFSRSWARIADFNGRMDHGGGYVSRGRAQKDSLDGGGGRGTISRLVLNRHALPGKRSRQPRCATVDRASSAIRNASGGILRYRSSCGGHDYFDFRGYDLGRDFVGNDPSHRYQADFAMG